RTLARPTLASAHAPARRSPQPSRPNGDRHCRAPPPTTGPAVATRSSVDPALGPARARPAATSRVLTRCDPVRARLTADRGIAVVLQGVDEDLVLGHVGARGRAGGRG